VSVLAWPPRWWLARSTSARSPLLTALGFLIIPLSGLLLFRVGSIGQALFNSFQRYNLISGQREFIGLGNYIRAFADQEFLQSLAVTFTYLAVKLAIQVPMALGLAMLVEKAVRGVVVVRAAIYLPVVTSYVVVATMWRVMYNPSIGFINGAMRMLGMRSVEFLLDPRLALLAVTAMTIWKDVGFTSIIFLAGLQGIPQAYYEAAAVDGAKPLQQFWHITLPLLKRITLFVLITTTIGAFQIYTPVYIMTQGGPMGRTKVITYYIYQRAFLFYEMGYASALAILLLVLILALSLFWMRVVTTSD
jgi:multiple sugar transport system permease protein